MHPDFLDVTWNVFLTIFLCFCSRHIQHCTQIVSLPFLTFHLFYILTRKLPSCVSRFEDHLAWTGQTAKQLTWVPFSTQVWLLSFCNCTFHIFLGFCPFFLSQRCFLVQAFISLTWLAFQIIILNCKPGHVISFLKTLWSLRLLGQGMVEGHSIICRWISCPVS